MDSRLRGNDKERKKKKKKKMDSRLRGNDKERKKKKKMDSRLRGNDKEKKTEKHGRDAHATHGQDAHATKNQSTSQPVNQSTNPPVNQLLSAHKNGDGGGEPTAENSVVIVVPFMTEEPTLFIRHSLVICKSFLQKNDFFSQARFAVISV